MFGERNNWYIDEKGNTVLYLGQCKFERKYTKEVPGCFFRQRPCEVRHLYISKENCLKWFSNKNIEDLKIEEMLRIITEDYLYSSVGRCLMYPKKPRELKTFLGENKDKINKGDIFQFSNPMDTITFEFI